MRYEFPWTQLEPSTCWPTGFGQISSLELAFKILDEAAVAVGPGRDFGEIAEGKLRFSYAASETDIEGIKRLGTWMQNART